MSTHRLWCCPKSKNLQCGAQHRFSAWSHRSLKMKDRRVRNEKGRKKSSVEQMCFDDPKVHRRTQTHKGTSLGVAFKWKTFLPMYLNGFPSLVSWLRHCSTTLEVHWFTLLCWYAFPPIVPSIDWNDGTNKSSPKSCSVPPGNVCTADTVTRHHKTLARCLTSFMMLLTSSTTNAVCNNRLTSLRLPSQQIHTLLYCKCVLCVLDSFFPIRIKVEQIYHKKRIILFSHEELICLRVDIYEQAENCADGTSHGEGLLVESGVDSIFEDSKAILSPQARCLLWSHL